MATWKKLIVSGADISQLNNDSNYLGNGATGASLTGSFSGSFEGDGSSLTGLTADSIAFTNITGKPTLVSASAQISYPDVSNIPNGIVSSSAQIAAGLPAGTVSGSSQIDFNSITNTAGIVSSSTQIIEALPAGTISSSAQIDDLFNQDGVVSSSAQIHGLVGATIVSSSAQVDYTLLNNIPADILSSSNQIASDISGSFTSVSASLANSITNLTSDYTELTNVPGGIVSASAIGQGTNQGEVVLIQNGNSGSAQGIGLSTTDSVQFNALTLTGNGLVQGNLTVQGDFTNLNTTNLAIEDKYILLNSGSTSGDSGIVFGGADGVVQSGTALIYDTSYNGNDGRLAVVNTLAANATTDVTIFNAITGGTNQDSSNYVTVDGDLA